MKDLYVIGEWSCLIIGVLIMLLSAMIDSVIGWFGLVIALLFILLSFQYSIQRRQNLILKHMDDKFEVWKEHNKE